MNASPLRVALVYNQKKEDPPPQSGDEYATDQSGLLGRTVHPLIQRVEHHPIVNPAADRYAEWDTFETIDAVRSSLAEYRRCTHRSGDAGLHQTPRSSPISSSILPKGLYGISGSANTCNPEMLQIPYTGSDPLTLATCLDKSRAQEILSYYNIPAPSFAIRSKKGRNKRPLTSVFRLS